MSKKGSMINCAMRRMRKMKAYGQGRSKHLDKCKNRGKPLRQAIYANLTYTTYVDRVCFFLRWAEFNYNCRCLEEARQYVAVFLEVRILDGLSAWTLHTDASAIAKLYGCSYSTFGVKLPPRRRADRIKNSKKRHAQM